MGIKTGIERIARDHLGVETLETRGRDALDFHDLSVASIRSALLAAWMGGIQECAETEQQEDDEMNGQWIGPDESLEVGIFGFLIESSNMERADRYELSDTPPHTNQSHAPRLYGWCGSWNNTSTYGRGMARVERVARNGRALVRTLHGEELRAALEELGYPELMPDDAEQEASA